MTRGGALEKGALLEGRVARLMTAEGGFVRRRVNLEAQFGERFSVITDIDVLAYSFGPDLSLSLTAVECKTTEARSQPGIGDRLLWLTGVRRLVGADHAILATHRDASPAMRDVAGRLGCEVIDSRDLARREGIIGLGASGGFGAHDPRLLSLEREVFDVAKADPDLKRVYWFARSEVWLASPASALKRGMGALKLLAGRWSERLPSAERTAIEWLVAQVSLGVILALVRFASVSYRQPEGDFERYLVERLAEGLADYRSLEALAREVDRYVVGVLSSAGVSPSASASAMGAFAPEPPPYLDPAAEVIARLTAAPGATATLPRVADDLIACRFLPALAEEGHDPGSSDSGRLLRVIAAFLERQARVPAPLLAALTNDKQASTGPALEPPTRNGVLFPED